MEFRTIVLTLFGTILTACMMSDLHAQNNKSSKVIVVGGGISGITAAHYLKKQHVEVLVLEAQEKLGGRLRTDRSDGVVFDEGASWIHGPDNNPITDLAKASGMETFLTKDDLVVVYNNKGEKYSDAVLEKEELKYEDVLNDIGGKKTESVAEYIRNEYPEYTENLLWRYMWSAFLEFDTGGDIDQLSSKYFYDDEAFDGEDLIVTNGYDRLIQYLSEEIPVELSTSVSNIDYSGSDIQVETNNGTFSADYVLVTVPLGVLKKQKIGFVPDLRSKTQKAIEYLDMGTVNKFLCVWDTAFWDVDQQYIGYTPEVKGKFNYFLNAKTFSNKNALMTFAFGAYSKQTETMSDEEISEEIMSHLKVIYGDSIPYPKLIKRTFWNTNPYTYGAYSFVGFGGKSKYYNWFKQKKKTNLFFAGEHTAKAYRGTVHGAYLSGLREAKRILKQIQ